MKKKLLSTVLAAATCVSMLAGCGSSDGAGTDKGADNTAENVVKKDGSTVVTVIFRPAEKLYAVLNCMAGSTLLYQFKDDDKYFFYEGDQLTIYPSRGYMKDAAAYLEMKLENIILVCIFANIAMQIIVKK